MRQILFTLVFFFKCFSLNAFAGNLYCDKVYIDGTDNEWLMGAEVNPDKGVFMTLWEPGDWGFELWEKQISTLSLLDEGYNPYHYDRVKECTEYKEQVGPLTNFLFDCNAIHYGKSIRLQATFIFDSSQATGSYEGKLSGLVSKQFKFEFSNCIP